eukprot:m.228561 g.228561  ORF g.228561 m.228561 type:complete len:310 (-) comp11761_c0_seq1:73-1002(-)
MAEGSNAPSYPPTHGNYILTTVSLVFIVVGTALIWYYDSHVAVNSDAEKAANYYNFGFYWLFLASLAILHTRQMNRRGSSGLFYFFIGGLLFELICNNEIASWAYGNLYRIYSADITRLTSAPTSGDKTAVKCMLAGVIIAHIGALLAVLSSAYHQNQHFSIKGTYITLAAWLLAVPGVICLFKSNTSTLLTINSSTVVYQLTWRIVDVSLGILTVQTIGVMFDIYELVASAVVIAGTNGIFLLGDMFSLQYQRKLSSEYSNDGDKVYAGGILCWLSVLVSIVAALLYFRKRAIVYHALLPDNVKKHYF